MRKLVPGLFLLLCIDLGAQQLPAEMAKDSLTNKYFSERMSTLPIYNGRQFIGYSHLIEGFPYLISSEWQMGSVTFEGVKYDNIPVLYDVHGDQLVARSPHGFPFILISERLQAFSIAGRNFVRVVETDGMGLKTGFYELLASGRAVVLAKRFKRLDEKIDGSVVEKKFISNDKIYISTGTAFTQVGKQRELLDALKEKKSTLNDLEKREGIRYKDNPELIILRLAEFYNQSIK